MPRFLISKPTRDEFREVMVSEFTLSSIDTIFGAAELERNAEYDPPEGGQRRRLVEQYYASVDFQSVQGVLKLLLAYEELLFRIQQEQTYQNEEIFKRLTDRMRRDGFLFRDGKLFPEKPFSSVLEIATLRTDSHTDILEHVDKARAKIEGGDCAGAITNAYTLVEGLLKDLLNRTDTEFNENEGDIRALFKLLRDPLNLNPADPNLEHYLKAVLDGLQKLVMGLYELANKSSDRHHRKYNPESHHAKLAVNSAFTFCEFLLDTYEYQRNREKKS